MKYYDETSKYYKELDLLRGFAIILVVIGHSFLVYPINIADIYWCSLVRRIIYTFHMPLFFAISGAVYKRKNYTALIKDKLLRLMVPYFFFVVLRIAALQLGGEFVNPEHHYSLQYLLTVLLKGGMDWFIVALFGIYATFPIVEMFLNYNVILELAFSAALMVLISSNLIPSKGIVFNLLQYYPYFIIGCIIYKTGINEKYDILKHRNKIVVFLMISLCFFTSLFCLLYYKIELKAVEFLVAFFAISFFGL